MRFHIDNRPEIGDTLTLRPLIKRLQRKYKKSVISVRTDHHGLLGDLGVLAAPVCCPICLGSAATLAAGTPYLVCQRCGLWFQPTPLKHRYENPDNENRGREMMTDAVRAINDSIAGQLVQKYAPKSALDVGSKYPWLLKRMKDRGVRQVMGIDGCELALDYGKELGVSMVQGNFLFHDFKGTKFDMVIMIHVLEHFDDPRQALRAVKEVLNVGGTLFVRVPTTDGNITGDLTENHYKIHPVLFNAPSLRRLLDEEGFETLVMWREPSGLWLDFELKYVEDRRGAAILHQWTNKTRHGDFIRRKHHFYKCPEVLACELGWLPKTDSVAKPLTLPPLKRAAIAGVKLPKNYAVIAHESGGPARQWPLDRWLQVAEWLAGHVSVVILGQKPLGAAGTIDLAGRTTVLEAASIISKAALVLSSDTAAAHIAAAAAVSTIALMGPADDKKTFPVKRTPTRRSRALVKVIRARTGCRRCYHALPKGGKPYSEGQQPPIHHSCDCTKSACMDGITVTQVLRAVAPALGVTATRLPKGERAPLLSVCMMVKNEERSIADALTSVHAAADEIVILDTGCTDKTIEHVRRFPKVKVFSHPVDKVDDFSELRNLAFSHATGRYVMWLDAGDRVSDASRLRAAVRKEASDVISLRTVFGSSVYWRARVVPRRFARFQHRIHETLVVDGLSERRVDDVVVNHSWFDKVGREISLDRNVRLLRLMLDEHPDNHEFRPRWEYYLARELRDLGKLDEAMEHYRIRVDLNGFWEERAKAAIAIADMLKHQGNFTEAIKAAYDALKLCDGWRDPYYLVGDCYYLLGNYEAAIHWFEHARRIPHPTTLLPAWADIYTWLCECQLSYCYEGLGRQKEALHWAELELKGAPPEQHTRIRNRVTALKGKLGS